MNFGFFGLIGLLGAAAGMGGGGGGENSDTSPSRQQGQDKSSEGIAGQAVNAEPAPQPEPTPPPEPVLQPEPAPEPEPEPTSEPTLQPDPAPTTQPEPAPEPQPTIIQSGQDLDAAGGRVTTISFENNTEISSIKVLNGPDHGNLTVNPDNTLALVMSGSDYSGTLSSRVEITYKNGSLEQSELTMDVTAPTQDAGWGQGNHYMLAEDENGDLVIETGESHRAVYVTESEEGLTRSDIAALEGLKEEDITVWWLRAHPEYGSDEEMALSTDVGMELWENITVGDRNGETSNWLLFENGYTYENMGKTILTRDIAGEDELHPVHITSWGEGAPALIADELKMVNFEGSNIVISDLMFTEGARLLGGENILFHNVDVTENGMNLQNIDRITLHDTNVYGVRNEEPSGADWSAFTDRASGAYISNTEGLLIEGSIFHQNGWSPDYLEEDGGMPPSMFSHNLYVQFNTEDVTFRDNIVSQGASHGAQFRGGVFAQDNLFLDNNVAVNFIGGDYEDVGPIGNFTLFSDNVITSGGHKYAEMIGAMTWGAFNDAKDSTLLDNIIAHLADPNNPDEIAAKTNGQAALQHAQDPYYDDTIIYGWFAANASLPESELNLNVEGLNPQTLDQTTIQTFAAGLLNDPDAGIPELMDYILSQPDAQGAQNISADDIVDFFQTGFNVYEATQSVQTHRFVPDALGDGMRWDNAINWSSEYIPQNGSNIDLAGNWVQFGGTATVNDLDLGSGGQLHVNYGKMTVEGDLDTGETSGSVDIDGAGQFWVNGTSADSALNIDIDGGRFANTGDVTGQFAAHVKDGDAILATDGASMTLAQGSELRLDGSRADVGFDGDRNDTATLEMSDDSTLSFISDETGFSTIEEFRSGAFGDDTADVKSGMSLDGKLQIDLSAQTGAGNHTLIDVDALHGVFDDIHLHGLADNLDAMMVFDYEDDSVRIELTEGSGVVGYDMIGDPNNGSDEASDLWAALTSGQGVSDETLPKLQDESGEIPEMLAF